MSPARRRRRVADPTFVELREAPAEQQFDDSAVDFDDELEEDQLPLDEVEAIEAGVLLDDPERLEP